MINRTSKNATIPSVETSVQRLQVLKRKKRPKLSSLKGFLFLLIAFSLSFMVFLTLFVVNKEFQESISASDEPSWSLPLDKTFGGNNLVTTRALSGGTATSSSLSLLPYYLKGKTQYKKKKFHHKKTFARIKEEEPKPISPKQKVWVLPDPVHLPTRNHESLLLEYKNGGEDKQILVNVLGRYSRGVQWMDLNTGEQCSSVTNGTDPDHKPLNDLNHVASVLVDSLESKGERPKKEVWLPCGFHNDRVGKEVSSNYVRIVDLETMEVRTGPKLPYSGGACGAAPIEAIPGEPPLVCAFGGTNGNHDTGEWITSDHELF